MRSRVAAQTSPKVNNSTPCDIEAVRCLKQFPWKHGISDDMSPTALVIGHPPPDFQKMCLEFGTYYVQVLEDNDPTNSTRAQSMGAIALGTTGNAQGDYNFMLLATGAKISRHQPMDGVTND